MRRFVCGRCVFCNNTQQLSLPLKKHQIVIFYSGTIAALKSKKEK
jgi:hypothetical protein